MTAWWQHADLHPGLPCYHHPYEGRTPTVQGHGQQPDRACRQRRRRLDASNGDTQLSGGRVIGHQKTGLHYCTPRSSFVPKERSIQGLHPPLIMASQISTRVSAPASMNWSNLPSTPPSGGPMTSDTQSPSRDGADLMVPGRKTSSATDLRRKTRIATWNVMTLTGIGYQVAIVREAARFNLGITGITEARIPGSDCRRVEDALILHSGGEQHTNGVALILRPPFDRALISWQPVSDRLLMARFTHRHGRLTVMVVYAPTEPTEDRVKDDFYNQLSAATQSVSPHDILTILGDFNAVSGSRVSDSGVVGPFGTGTPNNNSDRLLTYCGMHDLSILGSWFRTSDAQIFTVGLGCLMTG